MEDTKNKKLIAYHEVGHAIVGSVLENHDEVEKITLIPRGGSKRFNMVYTRRRSNCYFLVLNY
jgi:ATP-dependent Zn protease